MVPVYSLMFLIERKLKAMLNLRKMRTKMKSQMVETTALNRLRKLQSSDGLMTCSCLTRVRERVLPVLSSMLC